MSTSAPPSQYVLRWSDGKTDEQEVALPVGDFAIGRAQENELTLPSQMVSRRHARLEVSGNGVMIHDQNSANGVYVNGEKVGGALLRPGDTISIGDISLVLDVQGRGRDTNSTLIMAPVPLEQPTVHIEPLTVQVDQTLIDAPRVIQAEHGVVPEELLRQPLISERDLFAAGVEVRVAEFAALGAGLGSFVFVDYLRIGGVPAKDIAVVGVEQKPYGRYQRLASNSQIPPHERLRSNSDSCPDNIWGFPGYATREIARELKRGHLGLVRWIAWSIFGEPAIAQTYTPRSGDVFRSLDREAERIGWSGMVMNGRIRAIRKSTEGRLVAIVSASDERQRRHFAVSAKYMHLAIGYPAIQLLPDLAEYRERTGDTKHVVNAYESHEHVYQDLVRNGGTVMVRGRGIVASRILQKLNELRATNKNIMIIHLHRTKLTTGHRWGLSGRKLENQAEFQAFNWPKGTWGGVHRYALERASPQERARLLDIWGGTTTANRGDWRRILNVGTREGWYRSEYGVVKEVRPGPEGRVHTEIQSSLSGGGMLVLDADYVIDCTGLIAAPDRSTPLGDMIKTYNVPLNPKGRLHVSNDFEIEAMRHGESHMYACGAITLGGPYAVVDTFLGLQYAGLRAMTHIRKKWHARIRHPGGLYGLRQWLKWVRGVQP